MPAINTKTKRPNRNNNDAQSTRTARARTCSLLSFSFFFGRTKKGRSNAAVATKTSTEQWIVDTWLCQRHKKHKFYGKSIHYSRRSNKCIFVCCARATKSTLDALATFGSSPLPSDFDSKARRFHFVQCVLSSLLFNHILFSCPFTPRPSLHISFYVNTRALFTCHRNSKHACARSVVAFSMFSRARNVFFAFEFRSFFFFSFCLSF